MVTTRPTAACTAAPTAPCTRTRPRTSNGGKPSSAASSSPGIFGENLTLRGIDVTGARIGERWKIGTVVLEVTSPRIPCWKLAKKMEDPFFIKRFAAAGRPGAYIRIVQEGELAAGDAVEIVDRPDHDVTLGLFVEAYQRNRSLLPRLLDAPRLPAAWREWIEENAPRYSSTK